MDKEKTENEKKKEFLMSYQKEKRRVRRLEEQLEDTETRIKCLLLSRMTGCRMGRVGKKEPV